MKRTMLSNLVIILFAAALAEAATRLVPDEYTTIQAAIDACMDGDIVVLAPATYTGDGNRDIDFHGKAITVRSADPNDPNMVSTTIIDCNGTQANAHRGFYFHSQETTFSVVAGVTITNGYAPKEQIGYKEDVSAGGMIFCYDSRPVIRLCRLMDGCAARAGGGICSYHAGPQLTDCTFSGNSAEYGGAIYNFAGLRRITNCTFDNNSAASEGGGLWTYSSRKLTLTDCTFSANSATDGGGIYSKGGCSTEVITNCTFIENIAHGDGGAVHSRSPVTTLTGCIIKSNSAELRGGGLYRCQGTVKNCAISGNKACGANGGGLARCGSVVGCVITGNSSAADGGGLSECDSVRDCIVNDNTADGNGGGLHNCGDLYNCTIVGNRANVSGGGIFCRDGSMITNCIVWHNTATKGHALSVDTYLTCALRHCYELPSTIGVQYSDVQDRASGVYLEKDCTVDWISSNIDADPCFAEPGYWDPNGTYQDANDDFWVDGDYHLKSQAGRWDTNSQTWVQDDVTSPCIDAGDMSSPIGREPFPNGGVINMGAYGGTSEASKSYFGEPVCETIVAGDINGDCKVDLLDFGVMASGWLENNNAL